MSFWFHIKQPRQFHWAVAAQSGKPIMRAEGQVIKRQTGTIITRQGRRQPLDSPKFVLLSLVGIAVARITRDRGGPVALSHRVHLVDRKSRRSTTRSITPSRRVGKQKLFEMLAMLLFSFYFPFPQTFLAGLDKMQMFSPHAGVSRWWEPLSNTTNKPSVNRSPTCISMHISEHQRHRMETGLRKKCKCAKKLICPLLAAAMSNVFEFSLPKKTISAVILGITEEA